MSKQVILKLRWIPFNKKKKKKRPPINVPLMVIVDHEHNTGLGDKSFTIESAAYMYDQDIDESKKVFYHASCLGGCRLLGKVRYWCTVKDFMPEMINVIDQLKGRKRNDKDSANDLIAEQQLQINAYEKMSSYNNKIVKSTIGKFISIGGPLNDNVLKFNNEQLKWISDIHDCIVSLQLKIREND